jgi:hypothetical protein
MPFPEEIAEVKATIGAPGKALDEQAHFYFFVASPIAFAAAILSM